MKVPFKKVAGKRMNTWFYEIEDGHRYLKINHGKDKLFLKCAMNAKEKCQAYANIQYFGGLDHLDSEMELTGAPHNGHAIPCTNEKAIIELRKRCLDDTSEKTEKGLREIFDDESQNVPPEIDTQVTYKDLVPDMQSSKQSHNPWEIESIYELLYFNCPSCSYKNSSKEKFIYHACEIHPEESITYLKRISDNSLNDILCPWEDFIKSEPEVDDIIENEVKNEEEYFTENLMEEESIDYDDNYSIKDDDFFETVDNDEFNENEDPLDDCNKVPNENLQKDTKLLPNKIRKSTQKNKSSTTIPKSVQKSNTSAKQKDIYTCDSCDFTSKFATNLSRHVKNVHKGGEKYKCESCGKLFNYPQNMKLHIRTVHEKRRDYKCKLCVKSFGSAPALQKHTKCVHEQSYDHICANCGKPFYTIGELKKHVYKVHEGHKESHPCSSCGKIFMNKQTLNNHMRVNHEGIKNWSCERCGKNFGYSHGLKEHILRVHLEIKDHKCESCGKAFAVKGSLAKHIFRLHEGQRDKKCYSCGKSFFFDADLKKHIRSVHEGIKRVKKKKPVHTYI